MLPGLSDLSVVPAKGYCNLEIKIPSVENPDLSVVAPFKLGVASHALPAVTNFAFLMSAFLVQSTLFFLTTLQK